MAKINLLLHNIRSCHNVGSIFRTAEGFAVSEIFISGYTPYPILSGDQRLPHIARKQTADIHKTALGAESIVKFSLIKNLDNWLKDNKTPLIALEQTKSSINIKDFKPQAEITLIVGEEVNGIDQSLLDRCETCLEIPMRGQKESFNVAVAVGIALFALN